MSKTLIADDVSAIAARMKELALEQNLPAPVFSEDKPETSDIRPPDEGWEYFYGHAGTI